MPSSLQAGSVDHFVATSAEGDWEIVNAGEALPLDVQQRIDMIQMLMAYQGTDYYDKMQRRSTEKLGVSLRSMQRLIKSWQEQGLAGLSRQICSDHGVV